jgi:regulator of PEP synthase PpsR (kinase-PPPase family)
MATGATVFVVSDALGDTAEQVARGAISQFAGGDGVRVVRRPHLTGLDGVERAVRDAVAARPAIILYTLVKPEWRSHLAQLAGREGVPAVDVMGPVLRALSDALGRAPENVPGLSHRLDREYFERVEALEFAVRYDDGKDPSGVGAADAVILGVSRTSKTPVSLYLANHRLKVANIPLVPESPLPPEVMRVARHKCIGLVIDPETLMTIRHQRLKSLGLSTSAPYATRERILRELEYAGDVYRRIGCPVIDVTNHAVEETAGRILEILKREGGAR